jgi:glutathione peroxidase
MIRKRLMISLLTIASISQYSLGASMNTIDVETITGETRKLGDFGDAVLVIVNTASKCGFTKQYAGLVELQKDYKDKGVVVIGFPSGDFGGQELETNEAIAQFCDAKFGVDFPLMSKTHVKGEDQHPLFKILTTAENPDFTGDIRWNFEKFIVDQNGKLRRRFRSMTAPDSKKFREALDQVLSSKEAEG